MQLHVGAAELAAMLVEIKLKAVDHVLADLGEDAGHRRDETDAQFFRLRRRSERRTERDAAKTVTVREPFLVILILPKRPSRPRVLIMQKLATRI